jgi:hypothetical protein
VIFKSMEFINSVKANEQTLTFSEVGAHHQNGVAERRIRTATEEERVMMQDSFMQWPETFEMDLWPYALEYAFWFHSHIVNSSHGSIPVKLF